MPHGEWLIEEEYAEFEVQCDGEVVAGASGPHTSALAEARRYAAQYAADGNVQIFKVTRTLIA